MDKQINFITNPHISTDFISGLLAGFISVSATNGLEVAKTRQILNVNVVANKINQNGFVQTLKNIFKSEGLAGLYKGYTCTVFSNCVFHSLFFSFYNFSKPKFTQMLQNQYGEANKTLVNVGSSVSAAFLCNIITNPLWVVKTRMQSQYLHNQNIVPYKNVLQSFKKIYKEEGVKALYKGLFASLIGISHAMIYLPVYEAMKAGLSKTCDTINYKHIAISSMLSKIIAVAITYPHIVIRTTLQDCKKQTLTNGKFSDFKNMKNCVSQVYAKEGIKGFYKGFKFDLIRILPSNTITFVVYEIVKKQIELKYSQKLC